MDPVIRRACWSINAVCAAFLGWMFLAIVSGCAGHEAMVWRKIEPPRESCAIVVCESRMGRIDPKRDCTKCANSVGDIL